MKRTLQFIFIALVSFIALSCDNQSELGQDDANYYIRYEAGCNYPQVMRSVTVQTNYGSKTMDLPALRSWSETYGPVSKGFRASIKIGGSNNAKAKIYVSKNQEPFSLKESGDISASYTINF